MNSLVVRNDKDILLVETSLGCAYMVCLRSVNSISKQAENIRFVQVFGGNSVDTWLTFANDAEATEAYKQILSIMRIGQEVDNGIIH